MRTTTCVVKTRIKTGVRVQLTGQSSLLIMIMGQRRVLVHLSRLCCSSDDKGMELINSGSPHLSRFRDFLKSSARSLYGTVKRKGVRDNFGPATEVVKLFLTPFFFWKQMATGQHNTNYVFC